MTKVCGSPMTVPTVGPPGMEMENDYIKEKKYVNESADHPSNW